MPIVDGVIDIPAKEWCSLLEATLWIECGQVPIESSSEGAIDGRIYPPDNIFQNNECFLDVSVSYRKSLHKLYALVCAKNGVSVIGRQAVAPLRHVLPRPGEIGQEKVECSSWTGRVEISRERLISSGLMSFEQAYKYGFLSDGHVYASENWPDTAWAYSDLRINFKVVSERYHGKDVGTFGVGGEITNFDKSKNENLSGRLEDIGNINFNNSGRKEKYKQVEMLGFLAAILEDVGQPESDAEVMGIFSELYELLGEAVPSISTLKDKVIKPLNVGRANYQRAKGRQAESQKLED